MPFDPAKPANNAPLASAEMRAQLTALNADIQTRVTHAELASEISGTSSNSNDVETLDVPYGDPDAEALRQKVNELITKLRRCGVMRTGVSASRTRRLRSPSGFR